MATIVNMPKLGFDMAEGTLVRWVIQEGEPVAKGAVLAEIETDKATVEVESAYEGVVTKHLVQAGDIVPVNTPIAVISAPGEEVDYNALLGASVQPEKALETTPEPLVEAREVPKPSLPGQAGDGHLPEGVRASPLARRIAEERGVEIQNIPGSGPGGRITKKDVETYLEKVPAQAIPATSKAATVPTPGGPPVSPAIVMPVGAPPEDRTIPLNKLRAIIGRRMVEAKQQVPHFYVTHEYDVAALMSLREQVNALLPEDNKTSVNDYLLKSVALALREFPNLNASLSGDKIVHHGAVNIGVAVAVDGGLLTIVCRDADRKPVSQISYEVRLMAGRAREGKVRPEDIEGSTFSVSNLGMFDVEHFIAIINPPEAAILAVGSVREVPVISSGQVVPGLRMKATLSVDHRVSDGAEAARFLQALTKYIAEPLRLLV
jgi:pyruvate dehydrogenase E2 component (dihydrolipoyllysine-residue acetyltransferase)